MGSGSICKPSAPVGRWMAEIGEALEACGSVSLVKTVEKKQRDPDSNKNKMKTSTQGCHPLNST